jgi:hypothetical protein
MIHFILLNPLVVGNFFINNKLSKFAIKCESVQQETNKNSKMFKGINTQILYLMHCPHAAFLE